MRKVRVALLDHDLKEGAILQAFFKEKQDIEWLGWSLEATQLQRTLYGRPADVVILSLTGTQRDSGTLKALERADLGTRYLLYTSQADKNWHAESQGLPVGFVVFKQTPLPVLYERVRMVARREKGDGQTYQRPGPVRISKNTVATALKRTGLSPKLCGYRYLCRAVELVLQHPEWMESMTNKLYPAIAEEFGSTSQRVERSMRYAVESAFDCGDLEEIERVFGYTVDREKGKPSNRQYIARMADSLRIAQT